MKVSGEEDLFNDFVTELNKWDELRYPERRENDIIMHFRMEKSKSGLGFQDIPGRKSSKYELSLEEMDEFFEYIVSKSIVSKDFVTAFLKFGAGNRVEAYKEFNRHTGDLLS